MNNKDFYQALFDGDFSPTAFYYYEKDGITHYYMKTGLEIDTIPNPTPKPPPTEALLQRIMTRGIIKPPVSAGGKYNQ